MKSLQERDQLVNWHPYTQMKTAAAPIAIVKGQGVFLYDENGKRYIDAVSSWWVTLHGHAHPYIAQRVSEQLNTLEQVIFAGFTHEPAIQLAENLLKLLPSNQQKVFYTDNGSTAVEVALKMCLQYWTNQKQPKRKILAFKNAYHGDTFGAMSVSGRSVWTHPFEELLFDVVFIDLPNADNLAALKSQIDEIATEVCCFIYEPLVQGSAGMLMYDAESLSTLMNYCRSHKIWLIQDEVFTGFGRTGKLFATDHLTAVPDLMCFSKGLTGGTLPMGITTCTAPIYNAFYSDNQHQALFHGHSFTANPLACTAALASLELLLLASTQQNIGRIVQKHKVFSKSISQHPKIKAIRQLGTILAMEWNTDSSSYFSSLKEKLYVYFLEKGILLRPLGNILYILPPYCIEDSELDYIYHAIEEALEEL
ncbi:adenosylmethionine--8-amino-7-oxononanoate transaminase [Flavobacterium sp. NKUCC04_CG]|uniref:adenosylmethionine--8-amino-7-oxononanoate transaminase n=1 Tax=Flavobacterium sp. NKUCC04_CG TaxID=2842121 RepID=UPI001C5B5D0B|nr:adenosylmethionine--8-amino-7-oxononanoate transaminase [Flavobacterium sp. NKUCC04_CG]MBW3518547.1 adenosylmethionine--8-amino-7-oxononanoate transaminase [Flavobacterium sp. NKUCC04_CG]